MFRPTERLQFGIFGTLLLCHRMAVSLNPFPKVEDLHLKYVLDLLDDL